jgi:hypothetical protein
MKKSSFLILLTLSILTLIFALYFLIFHNKLSSSSNDWGNFGSYLAGTAGVLFSLVNFILIFFTFYEQRKNSLENTFNQLVSNYNSLISLINERWLHNDIDTQNNPIYRKGREIFGNVIEYIKGEDPKEKFIEIYYKHINVFQHYINFINETIETIKENTDLKEYRKISYYKRFSSQLSFCELMFIAYYSVYIQQEYDTKVIIREFFITRLKDIQNVQYLIQRQQFEFILKKLNY